MTPLRPVSGAAAGPARPRRAGSGFALPEEAAPPTAPGGIAATPGFLGLQEMPERPEDRARRRAGTMLAELRALQLDLLRGMADPDRLARLEALARPEEAGDPALAALVAEVALRARIETLRAAKRPRATET